MVTIITLEFFTNVARGYFANRRTKIVYFGIMADPVADGDRLFEKSPFHLTGAGKDRISTKLV
jgi:hypothetical protein